MSSGKNSVVGIALGVLLARVIKGLPGWVRRVTWRWRRILTPVWTGAGVWLAAVLLRWHSPEWACLGVALAASGTTLAVVGPRLSESARSIVMKLVPAGMDRGRDGVLDRPLERIYLAALTGWTGLYLVLRIGWGGSEVTATLWQVGLLLFGGSWWYHRRVRVAGRADRYARKWGRIREGRTSALELKALAGSKPTQVITMGNSARLRIKLAQALTPDHVMRATDALASYYNLRPGAVFARADEDSARHVWFEFLPKDPWAGKLQHPMPEAGSLSLRTTGGTFPVGMTAGGDLIKYTLQHTLVVGQSGSGKSIFIESILIYLLAYRRECLIVAIDMAGGATLQMWEPVLALPLATDVDSATVVLERVLAFISVRERMLGLAKSEDDEAPDSTPVNQDHPALVLIIDEFPDLIAEGGATVVTLLGRIGKKARKTNTKVILGSQNGSKADIGSKEFQAQLKCVVALRLDVHANKVLWQELTRAGWNSSNLKNGQFLIRDDDHTQPEPGKGWFVSPKERRQRISEARVIAQGGEPEALAALHGVGGPPVMEVAESLVTEPKIPVDAILAILRDEGPHSAEDLATLLGATDERPKPIMARATVYRRIKRHGESGYAHQVGTLWHYGPASTCSTCGNEEPPDVVEGSVA